MVTSFSFENLCSADRAPHHGRTEGSADLLVKARFAGCTVPVPLLPTLIANVLPALGTCQLLWTKQRAFHSSGASSPSAKPGFQVYHVFFEPDQLFEEGFVLGNHDWFYLRQVDLAVAPFLRTNDLAEFICFNKAFEVVKHTGATELVVARSEHKSLGCRKLGVHVYLILVADLTVSFVETRFSRNELCYLFCSFLLSY